jgi:geranylgeranyl reductase family protein
VQTIDVLVVGAGPAGTAAATTLARAGRAVVAVDKAHFPRDKICGDGLTTGALRLLESLGVRPEQVPSWQPVEDVIVHSPSGREIRFPLPRHAGVYAAVARRQDLDAALVATARDAGAVMHEGAAFEHAEAHEDHVVVTIAGRAPIAARYVIGADGMWSPLRKALGVQTPGYLGEWHAFRQYFAGTGPRARDLHVWFEADLSPGYAWSFPLPGGGANVGFGIARGGSIRTRDMKELWPALLARPHIAAVLGPQARPTQPHRAWPIPARVDTIRLSAHRALFVGDAAAATDPLTGEGIAQALLTGVLAGQAIITAGGLDPVRARRAYEHQVHQALVADHRLSLALMAALRRPVLARGGLRLAGSTAWTRRNFGRWLFEDYPRALLATPGRWHRGMFTGPGAYR